MTRRSTPTRRQRRSLRRQAPLTYRASRWCVASVSWLSSHQRASYRRACRTVPRTGWLGWSSRTSHSAKVRGRSDRLAVVEREASIRIGRDANKVGHDLLRAGHRLLDDSCTINKDMLRHFDYLLDGLFDRLDDRAHHV